MTAIRSKDYDVAEQLLVNDPIVHAMAAGLVKEDRDSLAHPGGTPRHEFMGTANREYDRRGGQHHAHIGAVAHALLQLLDEKPIFHDFISEDGKVVAVGNFRRFEIRTDGVELGIGTPRVRYAVTDIKETVVDPIPGLLEESTRYRTVRVRKV